MLNQSNKAPTGDQKIDDLCKKLNAITDKPARPFNQNVQNPSVRPPSKPLVSATPKPQSNQAASEPISKRFQNQYPMAFNGVNNDRP